MQPDHSFPLSEAAPGQRVCISKVGDKPSTLDYLGEHGLVPGRLLSVREVRDLDGVVIVEDEDGGFHALGEPLARRSSSGPRRDDARVAAGRVSDQHGRIDGSRGRPRLLEQVVLGGGRTGGCSEAVDRELAVLRGVQGREQAGFARVVTDRATFAYLADVFVLEEHRGQGIGKWLVEVILSHRTCKGCEDGCSPPGTPTTSTGGTRSQSSRGLGSSWRKDASYGG